ncbi:chloride channel protein [Streptomyces sp. MS1.HAVA.3]|uniref:Chloride channel protein n=1 Tax=Streptomyces caledonius TaxID=3134107 RepID=A0ABU8U1B9_9ACTN
MILAALLSLPLGATLGPEAPLIALGGGLALLFRDLARVPATAKSTALLGAAGAAAAVAVIFGSPLVAAVMLIEVAGVGGPQLFAVMLPALLSSGVGALVFTGFGRWTGFDAPSLSVKVGLPVPRLDTGDVVWAVLMAVAIGVLVHLIMKGGQLTARFVAQRTVVRTTLCALAAGVCAAVYALTTGRSPANVASSGQGTLSQLAADPHGWGVGALIAVLLCTGVAYSLCLGSLRGGPVFPSLFLGAAVGVLLAPLPGLGVVPAMAAGMAASTTSALRLPVSSIVLVVLVLDSVAMTPVVILAAVVAFVTTQLLPRGSAAPPQADLRNHRPPIPRPRHVGHARRIRLSSPPYRPRSRTCPPRHQENSGGCATARTRRWWSNWAAPCATTGWAGARFSTASPPTSGSPAAAGSSSYPGRTGWPAGATGSVTRTCNSR